VATGQKLRQLSRPGQRYSYVAFSPDGKLLAARGDAGIIMWNVETGQELRSWTAPLDRSPPAFSPDGKLIAAYDGLLVRFWETATGKSWAGQVPPGHEGAITALGFLPDGRTLIATAADQTLRWWDAGTGQERRNLTCMESLAPGAAAPKDPRLGQLCTMALSRDGARLAVAATINQGPAMGTSALSGTNWRAGIRLLDPASGKELRHLDGGNGRINSLAFSPDGTILAEAFAGGRTRPSVRKWDTASGQGSEPAMEGTSPLFSPDGRYLITLDFTSQTTIQTSIRFRHANTGKDVYSFAVNEFVRCCALSPDGTTLATGSDQVRVYSLSWKPEPRIGPERVLAKALGTVPALAFSPDSRLLSAGGSDAVLHVWELASGQERLRFSPGSALRAVGFTADSRRLASGGADSTILVWDLTNRFEDGQLRTANLSSEELEKCWDALASADAAKAGRALWTLAADPGKSVPFLREHLRLAAADLQKRLTQVPQFLRDLDAQAFAVRDKAKTELTRLGTLAEPAVREALVKPPSAEARRSLEQLLKAYEAQGAASETLRGTRAVELLEQIGTREARAVLETGAAGGFGDQVTAEARTALGRAKN
jgi:WD40 repeat protein